MVKIIFAAIFIAYVLVVFVVGTGVGIGINSAISAISSVSSLSEKELFDILDLIWLLLIITAVVYKLRKFVLQNDEWMKIVNPLINGVISFISMLTVALIVLKLINAIDWSWLYVTLPVWYSTWFILPEEPNKNHTD